ncbi:MAG: hypothetical protein EPN68_06495 [Rhodanobacter sp.]|nr:MAG: hypothetical protein EPN68_06495 [Rhodanobacter sp.]
MASIRIALLSDLHFFVKEDSSTPHSHLPLNGNGTLADHSAGLNKNPWDDLLDLIEREGLECDLVLCPGDITTRANKTALVTGWGMLLNLGGKLQASLVCAATGNHDVSSRSHAKEVAQNVIRNLGNASGPVESLKELIPLYPVAQRDPLTGVWTGERAVQTRYFGESFVLVDDPDQRFRLLILNSCSEHGHDPHEFEKGTAPISALKWIKDDLTGLTDDRVNLLMVHHPLYSSTTHDNQGYDFVFRGDNLMSILENLGDWVVMHGHKHLGEIRTASSASNGSSVIVSAASFAAVMDANGPEGSENQFYVLDIEKTATGDVEGTIRAWSWNVGNRWQRSPPGNGDRIFFDCGFGSRMREQDIAKDISDAYDNGHSDWKDITAMIPALKHILPKTLGRVLAKLGQNHGLLVETEDGWHKTVVRKAP